MEELYKKYKKDVYLYLYSLTHNITLAEDLTSETFLGAIKTIHSFKGKSSVKTWLFSIARNKWLNNTRKSREVLLINEINISSNDSTYEMILERIELILEFEKDINKNVFYLRLEGYSFYEIGNIVSLSESSCRVIYFRIRNIVKEKLMKEGYGFE